MHQANKSGAVFRLWRASSGSVVGSLMACGEEIKILLSLGRPRLCAAV